LLEVSLKKSLPGFTLEVAFAVNRETLAILGPSGSCNVSPGLSALTKAISGSTIRSFWTPAAASTWRPRCVKLGTYFRTMPCFPTLL
jgi:hypothetical protein